jgi:HEAT repeat protein
MPQFRPHKRIPLLITSTFVAVILFSTVAYAEVSPKQLKTSALQELVDINDSGSAAKQKLDLIIKFVQKSLEDRYWKDDWHLINSREAMKVFTAESSAVLLIQLAIKNKNSLRHMAKSFSKPSGQLEALFAGIIDSLVKADRLLAERMLFKAKIYEGVEKRIDHHIKKAKKYLERAYKAQENKKPIIAIRAFRKAWSHALSAIKAVTVEQASGIINTILTEMQEAFIAESWDDMAEAIFKLQELGEPVTPGLLAIATNKGKDVILRNIAVEIIADIGDTSAVEPLMDLLKDEEEVVLLRAQTAYILGRLGDKRAFYLLEYILNTEDTQISSMAALGLGLLGDEEAVPALIPYLKDEDMIMRVRSGRALTELDAQGAFDYYLELLNNDPEENVRGLAALWLGNLKDPHATEDLIRALEEAEYIACNAAVALGMIKDARAVEPLISALRDEGLLNIYAAEALAEIGDLRAVEPLVETIRSEASDWGREGLIEAYEKLTGQTYQE